MQQTPYHHLWMEIHRAGIKAGNWNEQQQKDAYLKMIQDFVQRGVTPQYNLADTKMPGICSVLDKCFELSQEKRALAQDVHEHLKTL